jgi:hypothetical protein
MSLRDGPAYDWKPAFSSETYSQIPHVCFELVGQERLIPFDLFAYAYFSSRAAAMEAGGVADFTFVPESQAAADLNCCPRSVRSSLKRLVKAGLLERQDTRLFSRTRVLVRVVNGKVERRAPRFPVKPRRARSNGSLRAQEDISELAPGFFDEGEDFPIM